MALCFRSFGTIFRLATDHFARSLHRNTLTIAALAAAIALTISVTVMIDSFRGSVQRWIDQTLTADLYIAPAVNETAGSQALMPAETEAWANDQPDVLEVGTFRELPIRFRDEITSLAVINGKARGKVEFLAGQGAERGLSNPANAWPYRKVSQTDLGFSRPRSSPCQRQRVSKNLRVCGIYRDFARDRGTILMPRSSV